VALPRSSAEERHDERVREEVLQHTA
jgi:hypothetical protein